MEWFQVILLALIQGLTEFLPISSSAHLILPSALLGWPDQGLAFDVAVHIGSLAAVVFYFRKDLIQLACAWLNSSLKRQHSSDAQLAWYIIFATIPAGLIGLLSDEFIETHLRGIEVIAATTILFGLLLGWSDKIGTQQKQLLQMTLRAAIIIGMAQAFALIPGTSRSGITITAALLLGFNRDASARFSFLLSIPLILIAGGLKTLQLLSNSNEIPWDQIAVATTLSALTAYFCIRSFIAVIDRIGMMPFVIYRLLLGGVLIAVFR